MTINKGYDTSEQKDITVIAINIDYYEELKRKADAYDAIKKGVIVEWDGGMYISVCENCGHDSLEFQDNYCVKCGVKLNW